jgi:WD40 repeat protein
MVASLPERIYDAAISPDGRFLAVRGFEAEQSTLLDARNGKRLAAIGRNARDAGLDWRFSPDGRTLAFDAKDRVLRLWDVPARRQRLAIRLESETLDMAFSPDGQTLAVARADDLPVLLLDVETGEQRGQLRGHQSRIQRVAFAPDGSTLATGGADRMIILWDIAALRPLATLVGHGDAIDALAFSPDGRTLASVGGGGTLRLWSVFSGRELLSTEATPDCGWLAFSPDGRTLAGQFGTDPRPTMPRWRIFLWSGEPTE